MTSAEEVLQHSSQSGWLVLASQIPRLGGETPELAERLLERMDLSRPPVCLTAEESPPQGLDLLLEEFETLLGVRPAVLPASLEPPTELAFVGLILLTGGTTSYWVEALENTLLGEVILQALQQGGVIFAVGPAAGAVGSWALPDSAREPISGLNWVAGAVVLPGEAAPGEQEHVRAILRDNPKAYALGLADHTLVALGPGGEIEVWGESQPTIILGQGWSEA